VPCFAHLQDAVLDEYILAHFLGWSLKPPLRALLPQPCCVPAKRSSSSSGLHHSSHLSRCRIGKSLIFRHAGAAWINSIVFEFVEMSFEHWMPNFAECWSVYTPSHRSQSHCRCGVTKPLSSGYCDEGLRIRGRLLPAGGTTSFSMCSYATS
jgi:hypothetical protein